MRPGALRTVSPEATSTKPSAVGRMSKDSPVPSEWITVGQRPERSRCASTATMRRISGGMAAAAVVARGPLSPRRAVDAADDRPFGEQFRLALIGAGLPVRGAEILVGIIFERRGERIFEIPVIGRRDRMAAGRSE